MGEKSSRKVRNEGAARGNVSRYRTRVSRGHSTLASLLPPSLPPSRARIEGAFFDERHPAVEGTLLIFPLSLPPLPDIIEWNNITSFLKRRRSSKRQLFPGFPEHHRFRLIRTKGRKEERERRGGPLTDTFLERNIRNFRGEKKEGNLVR